MPAAVVSLTCTPTECALVYDGRMGELEKRIRKEIPVGMKRSLCVLQHRDIRCFHTVLQFKVLALIVSYHRLI